MCDRTAYAQASLEGTFAGGDECFAYYDTAMHESVLEEQKLVSQLSYALASGQIRVYYQPIYDIAKRRIASAEALTRWEHPVQGLVFPGRFIPLFESNGMVTDLDKYAWNEVGKFLNRRMSAGQSVVPVSINVSRVDFFATTLLDDFDEIVSNNDLDRKYLRIEVTESAYTDDPGRIIEIADALRERGHKVLLDDFGSGYSSLNSLKDMSIDILKLDMSFMRGFDESDKTKHVIGHVVAMAHDLGLKVVAEGVETQVQLDFLDGVGCDLAQGFLFARPMPETDFIALLDREVAHEAS
jgi:EAL domain-containing protein (putative c-di-GMP-specific phosphodiesterase class I)